MIKFINFVGQLAVIIRNYNAGSDAYDDSRYYREEGNSYPVTFVIGANPDPNIKARLISPAHFVD